MASFYIFLTLPLFISAFRNSNFDLGTLKTDIHQTEEALKFLILARKKRFSAKDYCKATHKPISQERMVNEIVCSAPIVVEYIRKNVRKILF